VTAWTSFSHNAARASALMLRLPSVLHRARR
jgi:hypothetical protein